MNYITKENTVKHLSTMEYNLESMTDFEKNAALVYLTEVLVDDEVFDCFWGMDQAVDFEESVYAADTRSNRGKKNKKFRKVEIRTMDPKFFD